MVTLVRIWLKMFSVGWVVSYIGVQWKAGLRDSDQIQTSVNKVFLGPMFCFWIFFTYLLRLHIVNDFHRVGFCPLWHSSVYCFGLLLTLQERGWSQLCSKGRAGGGSPHSATRSRTRALLYSTLSWTDCWHWFGGHRKGEANQQISRKKQWSHSSWCLHGLSLDKPFQYPPQEWVRVIKILQWSLQLNMSQLAGEHLMWNPVFVRNSTCAHILTELLEQWECTFKIWRCFQNVLIYIPTSSM